MRSKEKISALKEEVTTENNQRRELTEEELEQVSGGISVDDLVRNKSSYMRIDRANNGYAHVQGKYDAPD